MPRCHTNMNTARSGRKTEHGGLIARLHLDINRYATTGRGQVKDIVKLVRARNRAGSLVLVMFAFVRGPWRGRLRAKAGELGVPILLSMVSESRP